jgi:hypothetical protein
LIKKIISKIAQKNLGVPSHYDGIKMNKPIHYWSIHKCYEQGCANKVIQSKISGNNITLHSV